MAGLLQTSLEEVGRLEEDRREDARPQTSCEVECWEISAADGSRVGRRDLQDDDFLAGAPFDISSAFKVTSREEVAV